MFYALKVFFKDRWILVNLALCLVTLAAVWGYTIRAIEPTESQIFLHYTVIFGIDQAGPWYRIYFLPGVGTVLLALNYAAAFAVFAREKILARIIAVVSTAWMTGLFTAMYVIVGLNI